MSNKKRRALNHIDGTHFAILQFSHSVASDSLQSHGLLHLRPPCPSPTPTDTQTHVHWVIGAIQRSHPLSCPSPPAFNLTQHQGLFKWSVLHIRWPKYWSFSFNISPSNEHLGLVSFRMDWLDLLAAQGTLRVFSNTTVQKINSSALSFLYSSTLTSIHDHWKNHSLD